MNINQKQEYGYGLATMGYKYTNIIRLNYKIRDRILDNLMNKLLKRPDVNIVWACIEPDLDKITNKIDPFTNHVHFAWKGGELTKHQLSNSMKLNRKHLRNTLVLNKSLEYFTKHLGKSLSYHNFYS